MASIVARTRDFTQQVVDEIRKVTWPDWPQLKNSTFVVLIFVVLVSLIIFGMDSIIRTVLGFVIDIFTG
jgi:preprotein translocase subunit SecE